MSCSQRETIIFQVNERKSMMKKKLMLKINIICHYYHQQNYYVLILKTSVLSMILIIIIITHIHCLIVPLSVQTIQNENKHFCSIVIFKTPRIASSVQFGMCNELCLNQVNLFTLSLLGTIYGITLNQIVRFHLVIDLFESSNTARLFVSPSSTAKPQSRNMYPPVVN